MNATSNIPLKVPFKEKDEAKSHGARWNPGEKHWYIPEGVEVAPFEKWLTEEALKAASAPIAKATPDSNQTPQTSTKKLNDTFNKDADIDDINAMLRDAFEDNDYS